MVDDKEIEEFLANADDKVITQEDKVDDSVGEQLGQMGWLWDETIKKLNDEHTCFECKGEIKLEEENIMVSMAGNTEKGTAVFVSLCEKCYEKLAEEQKEEETPDETKDLKTDDYIL